MVYEKLIYIFVLHMHDVLLSTSEGKSLSYKNTARGIIDVHLLIRDEAEHLPAVSPGDLDVGIPKVPSHTSVLFMVALNHGRGLQSVSALS